jgi:hypothetical protein
LYKGKKGEFPESCFDEALQERTSYHHEYLFTDIAMTLRDVLSIVELAQPNLPVPVQPMNSSEQ